MRYDNFQVQWDTDANGKQREDRFAGYPEYSRRERGPWKDRDELCAGASAGRRRATVRRGSTHRSMTVHQPGVPATTGGPRFQPGVACLLRFQPGVPGGAGKHAGQPWSLRVGATGDARGGAAAGAAATPSAHTARAKRAGRRMVGGRASRSARNHLARVRFLILGTAARGA